METETQMFQMISPPSGFPSVPLPFGDGVLSLLFFPAFSLCLPLSFGKRWRPSYFFMMFFSFPFGGGEAHWSMRPPLILFYDSLSFPLGLALQAGRV